MAYTKEDVIRIVKEEGIEFIRMQFVDIFGQLKNVAITADADTTNILQKMIKELTEEKASYEKAGREETVAELNKQLSLVEKFMPKMLSADEIKEIIMGLDDKTIPTVMKHFKMNYNGKCDMRLVQEVLRSL